MGEGAKGRWPLTPSPRDNKGGGATAPPVFPSKEHPNLGRASLPVNRVVIGRAVHAGSGGHEPPYDNYHYIEREHRLPACAGTGRMPVLLNNR